MAKRKREPIPLPWGVVYHDGTFTRLYHRGESESKRRIRWLLEFLRNSPIAELHDHIQYDAPLTVNLTIHDLDGDLYHPFIGRYRKCREFVGRRYPSVRHFALCERAET